MDGRKTRTDKRARTWAAVAYPESVPEGWRDLLDDHHFAWSESPLHDRDVDANGELKKPHWHLVFYFDGNKSFEQVKELTDAIHAPRPQIAASAKACVRYFTHMDNPDKAQYDVADIRAHGGFALEEMLMSSPAQLAAARHTAIADMIEYILDNNVTNFAAMMRYALRERREDWFPLLCDNSAYVIKATINGMWQEKERAEWKRMQEQVDGMAEREYDRDEWGGKRPD